MRFRNSFRLFIVNFKNTYKILLYNLVVDVICLTLSTAAVSHSIRGLLDAAPVQQAVSDVKQFLSALFGGNTEYLQEFRGLFFGVGGTMEALTDFLKNSTTSFVLIFVEIALFYLLRRFLKVVCHYAVGNILKDRMETYARTTFSDAYIKTLGRAVLYSVIYAPVAFVCDVITICLALLSVWGVSVLSNTFVGLFVGATVFIWLDALKFTLTNGWLPAMVNGQSVKDAIFGKGLSKSQFGRTYIMYVSIVYFVLCINIIGAVSTFASSLIITIPATYYLFICVQFVNYYTLNGKPYFITYESVIRNPSNGQAEGFFTAMERETSVDVEDNQKVK